MNTERVLSPHLTAKIVQGYVRHHQLGSDQLSDLIASIHRTLGQLGQPPEPEEVRTPAVSVRRSVHRDYVVCLDCGKELPYDWNEMKVVDSMSDRREYVRSLATKQAA